MKRLKCILGFHDYTKWHFIQKHNSYEDNLKRVCKKCSKIELYTGITDVCISTGYITLHAYHE